MTMHSDTVFPLDGEKPSRGNHVPASPAAPHGTGPYDSGQPLLKQTLKIMAAMVGAAVAIVGTLSLLTVLIVNKVVGSASPALDSAFETAPPSTPRMKQTTPGTTI